MSDVTTIPASFEAGKSKRILLTNRLCQKAVTKRAKFYDSVVPGLYVSITTKRVATFSAQVYDPHTGKMRCKWLGVFVRDHFGVEEARAAIYDVKVRLAKGENLFGTDRRNRILETKRGKTVAELVELRIDWMKVLEKKADGEMRPRLESWENVASHLRRLVVPKLGNCHASEITPSDIAELSDDIVAGKHDGKPSISGARHMRRATSSMFKWARQPGNDFVSSTCDPTKDLPPLPPEHPRSRVLSAAEIKILWQGLDHPDMPWDRRTRLAIKFALCTMLRSSELLGAHCDELVGLDGPDAHINVALKRVKKRRTISQPLSPLAVSIIKEAMTEPDQPYVFLGRFGNAPLERKSMSTALRGIKGRKNRVRIPGICEMLGLAPFSAHDLRRTAATLAADCGFSDSVIGRCLDHQSKQDEHGNVATVTGRVYSLSKRLAQKRTVLDAVAMALLEIVGDEPVVEELKMAA
jgi:integrase